MRCNLALEWAPGNTPLAHSEIPTFKDVKDPLQVWGPPFLCTSKLEYRKCLTSDWGVLHGCWMVRNVWWPSKHNKMNDQVTLSQIPAYDWWQSYWFLILMSESKLSTGTLHLNVGRFGTFDVSNFLHSHTQGYFLKRPTVNVPNHLTFGLCEWCIWTQGTTQHPWEFMYWGMSGGESIVEFKGSPWAKIP